MPTTTRDTNLVRTLPVGGNSFFAPVDGGEAWLRAEGNGDDVLGCCGGMRPVICRDGLSRYASVKQNPDIVRHVAKPINRQPRQSSVSSDCASFCDLRSLARPVALSLGEKSIVRLEACQGMAASSVNRAEVRRTVTHASIIQTPAHNSVKRPGGESPMRRFGVAGMIDMRI